MGGSFTQLFEIIVYYDCVMIVSTVEDCMCFYLFVEVNEQSMLTERHECVLHPTCCISPITTIINHYSMQDGYHVLHDIYIHAYILYGALIQQHRPVHLPIPYISLHWLYRCTTNT